MNKKQFLLCKKLFGHINHYQLLNEYIRFAQLFCFLSNINCQEQLKTKQTEKNKKRTSSVRVCIMSLNALCDTISKKNYSFKVVLLVKIRFPENNI